MYYLLARNLLNWLSSNGKKCAKSNERELPELPIKLVGPENAWVELNDQQYLEVHILCAIFCQL